MANESPNGKICAHEADAVKTAIRRVIRETRDSLGTAVDIRLWTKKKPWLAMGLAAAGGLAAAVLFRRGSKPAPADGDAPTEPPSSQSVASKPSKPEHGGIGAALASSLFDLAKFGVETAIMAKIRESSVTNAPPGDCRETTNQAAQL